MKPTTVMVIAALVAVVLALGWLEVKNLLEKRKQKLKEQAQRVAPKPASPLPVAAPLEVKPREVPPPSIFREPPKPVEEEREDPIHLFHVRLERSIAGGKIFRDAFLQALADQGDSISFDQALEEASEMNFKTEDLVALMVERHHSVEQIATFVDRKENPDLDRLFKVLTSVVTNGTPKERAAEILEGVEVAFTLDDEGESLARLLAELGCSPEDVATMLCEKTTMSVADCVIATGTASNTAFVVSLAKQFTIDLSENSEYNALRNGDVDFAQMAVLLRACEKDAVDVLDAEYAYGESVLDLNDLKPTITDLMAVGFTYDDALDGIYRADFTNDDSNGSVVIAFANAEVPLAEIVAFIRKEELDVDDLDVEMRDADVELRKRVEIFNAFFETEDKTK